MKKKVSLETVANAEPRQMTLKVSNVLGVEPPTKGLEN
jgi:hypothetical protein